LWIPVEAAIQWSHDLTSREITNHLFVRLRIRREITSSKDEGASHTILPFLQKFHETRLHLSHDFSCWVVSYGHVHFFGENGTENLGVAATISLSEAKIRTF
jgi:hypothetical protein